MHPSTMTDEPTGHSPALVAQGQPPLEPGDDAAPGTPGTGENLCPRCNGSGRDAGAECPECGGSGKVITGIGGG